MRGTGSHLGRAKVGPSLILARLRGMMIGEFLGEILLRIIAELVGYLLLFATGFLLLNLITLGAVKLAPFSTIYQRRGRKGKSFQIKWSPWHQASAKSRSLKAEVTCLAGLLFWMAGGVLVYVMTS